MEISDFSITPTQTTFRSAEITYNADAFTPDFLRMAAETYRQFIKPVAVNRAALSPAGLPEAAKDDTPEARTGQAIAVIEGAVANLSQTADELEADREVYSRLLAGTEDCPVLIAWDLTRNGEPIPCTYEGISQLKPHIIRDLWNHLKDYANPKSQEITATLTSPAISEATKLRSSSPETRPDEGQIM